MNLEIKINPKVLVFIGYAMLGLVIATIYLFATGKYHQGTWALGGFFFILFIVVVTGNFRKQKPRINEGRVEIPDSVY